MERRNNSLHWETVTPHLKEILEWLISEETFSPFNLVGGTNLSLRFGHRKSDDIDLFTDVQYGSLDFNQIEEKLKHRFKYYDRPDKSNIVGFGRSYYIGDSPLEAVKLDLMYTDPFIRPIEQIEGIRLVSIEDIAAMKICAICGNGRKKDYWDIHLLLDIIKLSDLIGFYLERHPYENTKEDVLDALVSFDSAEEYQDPKCFLGKDWDIIKIDIIDAVGQLKDKSNQN